MTDFIIETLARLAAGIIIASIKPRLRDAWDNWRIHRQHPRHWDGHASDKRRLSD